MFAVCWASAYATESSERTFSAAAMFTGAATFALISDIAARSGSSSPAIASSSSFVSVRYSSGLSAMLPAPFGLVGLVDRRVLLGVGPGRRVIGEHVRSDGRVHRDGD